MCAHEQWKTVSEVKPREGFGFEVRVHVSCLGCGVPLLFKDGGRVTAERFGLVGVVVADVVGD